MKEIIVITILLVFSLISANYVIYYYDRIAPTITRREIAFFLGYLILELITIIASIIILL